MRKINLKNIVWKDGEYYVAQCLNVDVSSFGKTKKSALSALDEALELYFEDIKCKNGWTYTKLCKFICIVLFLF